MTEHLYTLEKYTGMKSRYRCPNCNDKKKTFTRYINTQTGEYLADHVGKCNRLNKCDYHYPPKQYFQDNNISFDAPQLRPNRKYKPFVFLTQPVSYIPVELFKGSLKGYERNNFVKFLINHFGFDITNHLISQYYIGSSKYWSNATVFWQIDTHGKIRTGKIMLYDPVTGKRTDHIMWAHKALELPQFTLQQCLFGAHLLTMRENKNKPVAIFESEKTALIAAIYMPMYVCVSVGGANGLNAEKCEILTGRQVILFPDISTPKPNKPTIFELWNGKAMELNRLFPQSRFIVSDLLEKRANESERLQGLDVADYLLKFDFRIFIQATQTIPPEQDVVQPQVIIKEQQVQGYCSSAYLTKAGKLLIPTPPAMKTYSVYPDIDTYNKRLQCPVIEPLTNYNFDELRPVTFNLENYTIEP